MSKCYIGSKELKEAVLYSVTDKIRAIKAARNGTGMGLREAKLWVEAGCPLNVVGEWGEVIKDSESVGDLMAELFTLTERIAAIHIKLHKGDYEDE